MPLSRRQILAQLAAAGPVLALGPKAFAADQDFPSWLKAFKQEAVGEGISPRTLDIAFKGVQPIPKILEYDRRQPETTITFDQYISRIVSDQRVNDGRKRLNENRPLLAEISQRYNVQARFIVALWGIETGFGAAMGDYPVVAALATLAYDGRRGAFFRKELIAALKILDQGHIRPQELKGSWAGAMGQTQFMPSSFLAYAVDYTGSGKQDIWTNRADVFASIANYLKQSGWNGDLSWGQPVNLPPGFSDTALGGKVLRPVDDWAAQGITQSDGQALPASTAQAGLVQPGGPTGPTLMVYDNYRVIMKWNRSLYFATAVSYLADRIDS